MTGPGTRAEMRREMNHDQKREGEIAGALRGNEIETGEGKTSAIVGTGGVFLESDSKSRSEMGEDLWSKTGAQGKRDREVMICGEVGVGNGIDLGQGEVGSLLHHLFTT